MRLNTSSDIKKLIAKQIRSLLNNEEPSNAELKKSGQIGFLANIQLKAIESADLEKRLDEIEKKMSKGR